MRNLTTVRLLVLFLGLATFITPLAHAAKRDERVLLVPNQAISTALYLGGAIQRRSTSTTTVAFSTTLQAKMAKLRLKQFGYPVGRNPKLNLLSTKFSSPFIQGGAKMLQSSPVFQVPELTTESFGSFQNSYLNAIFAPLDPQDGQSITIGVLDTGVDSTHPALRKNLLPGWDVANNDPYPDDPLGHGTAVASYIIGTGMFQGVAPAAKVRMYKVFNDVGTLTYQDLIEGIDRATTAKVDIISMSLGFPKDYEEFEDGVELLYRAVLRAQKAGIIVVAAAGNDNWDTKEFVPADLPGVIAVGAADPMHTRTFFSNWGPRVDIYAPGWEVLGAAPHGFASLSGTSMACPLTAGAIAVILSRNPITRSSPAVLRLLHESADATPIFKGQSAPHLNLARALGYEVQGLIGYALDATAMTVGGSNIGIVTVTLYDETGVAHQITTGDSGYFYLPATPGEYYLTWSKEGFVSPPGMMITIDPGVTTVPVPLTLVPSTDDGRMTIWTVHRTSQAAFVNFGDGSNEPLGTSIVLRAKKGDTVVATHPFFGEAGALNLSPYMMIGRASVLDSQPVNSIIMNAAYSLSDVTIEVENLYYHDVLRENPDGSYEPYGGEDPMIPGLPLPIDERPVVHFIGGTPLSEADATVYIAIDDGIVATLRPPLDLHAENDVPGAIWEIGSVNTLAGTIQVRNHLREPEPVLPPEPPSEEPGVRMLIQTHKQKR